MQNSDNEERTPLSISHHARAWKAKLPTSPQQTAASGTIFANPAFFVGVAVALVALPADEVAAEVIVAALDAEEAVLDVVATALTYNC